MAVRRPGMALAMAWNACMWRQRSGVLMHGSSLRGVSLTRLAHPVGLGALVAAVRPVMAGGWALAGALVATVIMRATTATDTSQRSGDRRGYWDIWTDSHSRS